MENAVLIGAGALWLVSSGWLVALSGFALLQPIRRRTAPSPVQLPSVSIIVPTSAIEIAHSRADRLATLQSLRAVETAESEILVCIDRGEPQGALAGELSAAFPGVRVEVADDQSSANAKVDAMA